MEAENLKKLTADQWLNVLGGLIAVEQLLPEMVRDSKQRETLTGRSGWEKLRSGTSRNFARTSASLTLWRNRRIEAAGEREFLRYKKLDSATN